MKKRDKKRAYFAALLREECLKQEVRNLRLAIKQTIPLLEKHPYRVEHLEYDLTITGGWEKNKDEQSYGLGLPYKPCRECGSGAVDFYQTSQWRVYNASGELSTAIAHKWIIGCQDCHRDPARKTPYRDFPTKEEAITTWNEENRV